MLALCVFGYLETTILFEKPFLFLFCLCIQDILLMPNHVYEISQSTLTHPHRISVSLISGIKRRKTNKFISLNDNSPDRYLSAQRCSNTSFRNSNDFLQYVSSIFIWMPTSKRSTEFNTFYLVWVIGGCRRDILNAKQHDNNSSIGCAHIFHSGKTIHASLVRGQHLVLNDFWMKYFESDFIVDEISLEFVHFNANI